MTLVEHLTELRVRIIRSVLAIFLGSIVGWFVYDRVFAFLERPFNDAAARLSRDGISAHLILEGVADAFNLHVKMAVAIGAVLTSPIWLYQLFRFVSPGLLKREKRWAFLFVAAAAPLFLVGVVTAYLALPRILYALLSFAPSGVSNLTHVDDYMGFLVQLGFFFGIGFVVPVLVVTLNFVGVLSARRIASWWRWILFLSLVFAAVANPTGDVFTMVLFAIPQLVLMVIAYLISLLNDRRRARRDRAAGFGDIPDDQASPLDLNFDGEDSRPSDLHEAND
jgi:sec-independent protein translocase protein TatC